MTVHTQSRPRATPVKRRRSPIAPYLFLAPFFVVFLAMLVVPLAYAGYLSFFQSRLIGGQSFAGFANYTRALTDPAFLDGIGHVAGFLFVQVPIMLVVSLFIALALDSGRAAASRFVRLMVFVPYAVPGVVATLMWGYVYGFPVGPVSQLFAALGISAPNLLSAGLVLPSMMNIVTWEFAGYNMIIMYAALRSIPQELFDSAAMDGAGNWRIAWSIKIPAIRPAILLTVIFSIIGSFQIFSEPNLIGKLVPSVIGSAYTPNLYAYNLAFVNQDVNYAAAIAFLLGIVIMIVSLAVQTTIARRERLL